MTTSINVTSGFLCTTSYMHPSTFIACGLPGLSELAARLEQEPEFNPAHLFFSDATTDEELLSRPVYADDYIVGGDFTYDIYGDLVLNEVEPTSLEEEEQRAERDHARRVEQEKIRHLNALANIRLKYNLQQQKELLKVILPRVAPSLETLVYLPYLQLEKYNRDESMMDIFLGQATSFTSLKRLTLRLSNSHRLPELPNLTHLHLILNRALSIPTISSLTSSIPSLTHLRLTSINMLPHDLIPSYVDPGLIAHIREALLSTIPDRYPLSQLAASLPQNLTLLLQPSYAPTPDGFCATNEVTFDAMVERVKRISEAYENVKLLWPVKKDWERRIPTFPLSRALQEGGWTDEEGLPSAGEWEWDADGREGEEFWWNNRRNTGATQATNKNKVENDTY